MRKRFKKERPTEKLSAKERLEKKFKREKMKGVRVTFSNNPKTSRPIPSDSAASGEDPGEDDKA